jgi:putative DNA primase/helicase
MDMTPTIHPLPQETIDALYQKLRNQQAGAKMHAEPSGNGAGPSPSADDEIILQKAKAARNGEKFQRLWDGDTSDYAFFNPDGTLNLGHSEADLALCRELAFWTQNEQQIDRIFRCSGLCRGKWEHRADYRESTIQLAIKTAHEHWRGASAESSNGQPRHDASEPEQAAEDERHTSETGDDQQQSTDPKQRRMFGGV